MLGGGAPQSRRLVGAAVGGWEVSAGPGGDLVAPGSRIGGAGLVASPEPLPPRNRNRNGVSFYFSDVGVVFFNPATGVPSPSEFDDVADLAGVTDLVSATDPDLKNFDAEGLDGGFEYTFF